MYRVNAEPRIIDQTFTQTHRETKTKFMGEEEGEGVHTF